jgi:hypothetical protein
VVLTPPEGIPAEVERPAEAAMAAAAPLGTSDVDSVDESDGGLGDGTAITFR